MTQKKKNDIINNNGGGDIMIVGTDIVEYPDSIVDMEFVAIDKRKGFFSKLMDCLATE